MTKLRKFMYTHFWNCNFTQSRFVLIIWIMIWKLTFILFIQNNY